MNKNQAVSTELSRGSKTHHAVVPRIVKPKVVVSEENSQAPPPDPAHPLKPSNVMKAVHVQKRASHPWLTTAKIPTTSKIP